MKYLKCPTCGSEITILDFQMLVGEIAASLPPVKARKFTMKLLSLYRRSPEYAIEVLHTEGGDFFSDEAPEQDYLEELENLIKAPKQTIRRPHILFESQLVAELLDDLPQGPAPVHGLRLLLGEGRPPDKGVELCGSLVHLPREP